MIAILKNLLHHVITGNSLKVRLIRGSLGSAGIQVANRILSLALSILLARLLGAKSYGIYVYAVAILTLLTVAAEAGIPILLMREVAANYGRNDWGLMQGVLRFAARFVAFSAGSVAVIGLLIVWAISERLSEQVLTTTTLMLLVLPISAGSNAAAYALRGLHQVVLSQALDMLLRPALIILVMLALLNFWPKINQPQHVMAAQLGAATLVLIISLLILRRLMPDQIRRAVPVYRKRQWLSSALPFTLLGGAGLINSQADIIMLGWFDGADEVGRYRVAVQGATLVAFSLQVANSVLAPQFSRLHAQGNLAGLQQLVTYSAKVTLLAATPLALGFILIGAPLIKMTFGAQYADASTPLAILAVGQLINAGFGSVGFLLNMTGHERIAAKILWQTALLNILLNGALIPPYGMNGAAIATTISLATWNFLLYQKVRQSLGINSLSIKSNTTNTIK